MTPVKGWKKFDRDHWIRTSRQLDEVRLCGGQGLQGVHRASAGGVFEPSTSPEVMCFGSFVILSSLRVFHSEQTRASSEGCFHKVDNLRSVHVSEWIIFESFSLERSQKW